MAIITKKLITYAKKEKRSVLEIMNEFSIDKKHVETLRRALKKEKIKLKDNRGRKKEVFGEGIDYVALIKNIKRQAIKHGIDKLNPEFYEVVSDAVVSVVF